MARPVTNAAFEGLLSAAGYGNGHAAFARQLNHAGRDQGAWRYDAASVYWWLRGRRPGDHVQAAMAETLTRKLGRSVAVTELGFGAPDSLGTCVYPASVDGAINTAEHIWTRLAKHLHPQVSEAFDSGKALQAALGWRYDPSDVTASRSGRQQVTPPTFSRCTRWRTISPTSTDATAAALRAPVPSWPTSSYARSHPCCTTATPKP